MAFFRKFKFHYRHKKLSEEWALATSLKDISEISDNATCFAEEIELDSTDLENQNVTSFDLKYLGSTSIDAEKSEKSTAEAIKSVVALSKGAKKKSIQKVKVSISPQGIEVTNSASGDNLVRVSIYKISYCSADAANDHVFAFVGSETDSITNYEQLLCHVFYCPKRKIAHDVTLTVARCFEQAYQKWKEAVDKKMLQEEMRNNRSRKEAKANGAQIFRETNTNVVSTAAGTKPIAVRQQIISDENKENSAAVMKELLIDLSESEMMGSNILQMNDAREYLQNTWVSFEDESSSNQSQKSNEFCEQLLVC